MVLRITAMSTLRFMIIVTIVHYTQTANILGISPLAAASHFNLIQPVFLELAKRGHNVTVISARMDPDIPPNYRHIKVDAVHPMSMVSKSHTQDDKIQAFNSNNFILVYLMVWTMFQKLAEASLQSEEVKEFIINDATQFDVIICEEFALTPYYMFGHKYGAPLITYLAMPNAHFVNNYMGNPMNLHYINHEFYPANSWKLWDKMYNIFLTYFDILVRKYYFMPKNEEIARNAFSSLPQPLPRLSDIEQNVSLVLLNSHFAVDNVKSLLPNMVEFGGAHIRPTKQLPKDLLDILDNANEGVIIFSLGSNINMAKLPQQKIDSFMKVFSNVKQTVLMKWENDTLPGKPKNVITKPWLPQSDLLAHPNTKLFITHGGWNSILETVYHGVPIIGIPLFGDQPMNMAKAKGHGYAESLDYNTLNEYVIKEALDKVLLDPKYIMKAKELSTIMKDRPMSPLGSAIYWIEYVIRHKGAYHIKTPASTMTWYEYYLLDVIVILMIIGFASIWISIKIIKKILCKLINVIFKKKVILETKKKN